MPSAPATIKDSPAGDMAPFIIFMAFVILTTVIIMSIYRINSEEDETFSGPQSSGFTITLRIQITVGLTLDLAVVSVTLGGYAYIESPPQPPKIHTAANKGPNEEKSRVKWAKRS